MTSPWRPTEEEKKAILYLEALGLIHDLGKLSDKFLQSRASDKASYGVDYRYRFLVDPRQVFPDFTRSCGHEAIATIKQWQTEARTISEAPFIERPDLTAILENSEITSWDGQPYNLAEMALLANRPTYAKEDWGKALGKDMAPALLVALLHGVAHYEKEDAPDPNSQPYTHMYRATPFGREERVEVDTGNGLTAAFKKLPLARLAEIATDKRQDWLRDMRALMSRGLADTRRPQNDLSLWDWGFTVASLTKAMAAWLFKTKPANLDFTTKDWLAWRPLRINLDILGLYQRTNTIPDLLGVRAELEKAFSRVRKLLEEDYALANCFYHDETGAYYLFPDFDLDNDLRRQIRECFPLDLQPQVYLAGRITGSELDAKGTQYLLAARRLLAEPRQHALAARETPTVWDNNLYPWAAEWQSDRPPNAEICPVCGLRPVGYPLAVSATAQNPAADLAPWATEEKAKERNICRLCLTRRGRRSQHWAENNCQGTIWTDEVADHHGRLALVVGRLGLEDWLDGSLFSTIMIKQNLPKAPSPARLYRVAETGRRFWQQVNQKIAPAAIAPRPHRLAFFPDLPSLPRLGKSLGPYHAYELNWGGLSLAVVWDAPSNSCRRRFVTIENLDYFARRHGLPDDWPSRLTGSSCRVTEPGAAGKKSKNITQVSISQVQPLDSYCPIIELLAEPTLGLLLVPADQALKLVQAMWNAYEEELARVRDRLPLYLGLIFFPRRTPIRAVLEAGQALLRMGDKGRQERWGVTKAETRNCSRHLTFDNGVSWKIPLSAGDGQTADKWYPYYRLCPSIHQTPPQITPKHVEGIQARDPKTPLDRGPKIRVSPSRFDFEFLDTSGRRFEISYDEQGRRRSRPSRPFLLDHWGRLEKLWQCLQDLSLTQRYQVVQTIEAAREIWCGRKAQGPSTADSVFRQFVRDTLATAAWQSQPWSSIPPEIRQHLEEAAVRGELTDLAELHLQILKEK